MWWCAGRGAWHPLALSLVPACSGAPLASRVCWTTLGVAGWTSGKCLVPLDCGLVVLKCNVLTEDAVACRCILEDVGIPTGQQHNASRFLAATPVMWRCRWLQFGSGCVPWHQREFRTLSHPGRRGLLVRHYALTGLLLGPCCFNAVSEPPPPPTHTCHPQPQPQPHPYSHSDSHPHSHSHSPTPTPNPLSPPPSPATHTCTHEI